MREFRKLITAGLALFLAADAGVAIAADSPSQELSSVVSAIFQGAISIGVSLSAIVIAFGGILVIISYLRGSFKDDGKEWVKAGFTGLFITLSAWAVLQAINPEIFKFDPKQIPGVLIDLVDGGGRGAGNRVPTVTYEEIPLGKLTEDLLVGKTSCYDFDAQGNPMAGMKIKGDDGKEFLPPTYLKHDRLDCYVKLMDAAEKKTLALENVGKEVARLMQQCSCKDKCKNSCDVNGLGCANDPVGEDCSNNTCAGAACSLPDGWTNSLLTPDTSLACCPDDVKLQIRGYLKEHGDGPKSREVNPISLEYKKECDGDCGDGFFKKYYGLDEFYSKGVLNIEKKAEVNDEEITYIDLGECGSCLRDCACAPGDDDCLDDQPKCMADRDKCLLNRQICLNDPKETPWAQLNLIEQLQFIKGKIQELHDSVKEDVKQVTKASEKITESPLIKPYVEFIKNEEGSDAEKLIIKSSSPFPNTNPKEYCQGFAYANSQAEQACTDICPINQDSLSCYKNCSIKDQQCSKDYDEAVADCDDFLAQALIDQCKGNAEKRLNQCLENNNGFRETCTQQCYNKRACGSGSPFTTYEKCLQGYENSCANRCSLKYLPCSEEFKNCEQSCKTDSQCLQKNVSSCTVSPALLASCNILKDDGAAADVVEKCIQDAYLCQSGSQQHAGYADCLTEPEGATLFSSSYLYKNPNKQLCSQPYADEYYYGSVYNCLEKNPVTKKCPVASQCPVCGCGSTERVSLSLSMEHHFTPDTIDVCATPDAVPEAFWEDTECNVVTEDVKDQFRMVVPQCNEPAYNGDPATFYRRTDYWNESESNRKINRGLDISDPNKSMICDESREIPIGMATDHSVAWGEQFAQKVHDAITVLDKFLTFTTTIQNAKDYCSCTSKYESGEPICKTCCDYVAGDGGAPAKCQIRSCQGNSCQQMVNWLGETMNYHRDIKEKLLDTQVFAAEEGRSEALKELTYARTQTDNCSNLRQNAGYENFQLLSCQQAMDDILLKPDYSTIIDGKKIMHYCYGASAGKIFDNSAKTDNWFCCETTKQVDKVETPEIKEP